MAVAVRGVTISGRNISTVATQTRAVATPAGTADGDVLYAFVTLQGDLTLTTIPAGGSGGAWTLVPNTSQVSGVNTSCVYRKVWRTGDATTFTWGTTNAVAPGSRGWTVNYVGVSGADITTPEDTAAAVTSGASHTAHVVPTQNVASVAGSLLLFAVQGLAASGSVLSGTGFTALGNNTYLAVASYAPSTYGTLSALAVSSASTDALGHAEVAITVRPLNAQLYQYPPTSAAVAAALPVGGRHVLARDGVVRPERATPATRARTGWVVGPNAFSRTKHCSTNTTSVAQHNSRSAHKAMIDGFDPRFVFGNVLGIEVAGPTDFTLTAALEVTARGDDGSAAQTGNGIYPLTFGGQKSVLVPSGSYVKSDPLPIRLEKGLTYFVRTYRVPVGGAAAMVVQRNFAVTAWNEASDTATASDLSATGTISGTGNPTYGPQWVEVTPPKALPSLMVVGTGDSILEGASAGSALFTWFDIVMELAQVPHTKLSMSGEQSIQFWGVNNNSTNANGRYRQRFLAGATDVVDEYASNDFNSSATLANMQQRCLVAANYTVNVYGARYHRATVTPKTNSSDSWTTVAGQTAAFTTQVEADRQAFNAWLRDGAPVTGALVAAATGSNAAGVYRIGDLRHTITGVIDVAAAVEVTGTGGIGVYNPNVLTTDGWHPGLSGANLMAQAFATYAATHFALTP